jgi:DNA-binding CsgD family transcriptional regulator
MNLYSFAVVSVFYLSLPLSLYVLFLDVRSRVHRLFFSMSLSSGLWNLLAAFVFGADSREAMMLWLRVAATASIIFFPLVLHFSLALTQRRLRWWLLVLIYAPSALFHYRNWTGFFLFDDIVRVGSQWVFHPAFGSPWAYAWFVGSYGMMIAAFALLFRQARRAPTARARRQARIILLSLGLFLLLGVVNDLLLAPLVRIPPISPVFNLVFVCGTFYAMARYRFLSITHRTVNGDIIGAMEVPVILTDPTGAILKVNQAAEVAMGVVEADAIGQDLVEFSGGGRLLQDGLHRLQRGGVEVFGCTLRFDHNRSALPMEVKLSLVKDEFGEALGVLLAGQVLSGVEPFLRRYGITRREWEVVGYAVSGLKSGAIASLLGIAERTVKTHLANVYGKLGVQNRIGLAGVLRDHNLFAVSAPPASA